VTTDAVTGPDGRRRCPWALGTPDMLGYHDGEWGRPIVGDTAVFERLCLEAMQSGLSWLIVLRKRAAMRAAFAGFAMPTLAGWGTADVERLLVDPGIIRNRRKIEAVIGNARVALDLPGGLAAFIGARAPGPAPRPRRLADIAPTSPESAALAKELRRRGMRFVGPTTLHALFQAGGWVDDHLADCETAP
jgi:DNA-3-methyladenine glycosylase I